MSDTRRLPLAQPIAGTVGRCREFAVAVLTDWCWLPAADERGRLAAQDVLLVVSELVTNACLHAGGPVELVMRRRPGQITVEVTDRSPDPPVLRPPDDRAQPGGHGLRVVTIVSLDWGTRPSGGGKTVWARVGAG
ncbi:ATP-binding protein [Kitasatospora sp. RB6PN24]|uniref:ATP-binding protein n=1 Tax=Kitasatospora humi TaxID=2893891 RepID=UPI001E5851FE|nr:ATP-binding protein [Kitasatospora humi]MCC9307912.1 ATP-binding protein [Kitasatospora humi]